MNKKKLIKIKSLRKKMKSKLIGKESHLDRLIGIIPNNGRNSVNEVRKIRKKLSKEPFDIEYINSL